MTSLIEINSTNFVVLYLKLSDKKIIKKNDKYYLVDKSTEKSKSDLSTVDTINLYNEFIRMKETATHNSGYIDLLIQEGNIPNSETFEIEVKEKKLNLNKIIKKKSPLEETINIINNFYEKELTGCIDLTKFQLSGSKIGTGRVKRTVIPKNRTFLGSFKDMKKNKKENILPICIVQGNKNYKEIRELFEGKFEDKYPGQFKKFIDLMKKNSDVVLNKKGKLKKSSSSNENSDEESEFSSEASEEFSSEASS